MKTTLNFGVIKETVVKKAAVELTRGYDGDTFMRFMEAVKNNSCLKKQHYIYKNIETVKPFKKERIAERFLNQNLKIISNVPWNEIIKENLNLRTSLLGHPDKSTVTAKEEKRKLYEAISTLIEAQNNPAFKRLQDEADAYEHVISFLTREPLQENESNQENQAHPKFGKMWEYITKNAVSNFNERFSHLNENEKKLFKVLTAEGEQRITYIKSLKEETSNLLNRKINESTSIEDKAILEEFKTKLEKQVDDVTLVSDNYIFHVADLYESLKSI